MDTEEGRGRSSNFFLTGRGAAHAFLACAAAARAPLRPLFCFLPRRRRSPISPGTLRICPLPPPYVRTHARAASRAASPPLPAKERPSARTPAASTAYFCCYAHRRTDFFPRDTPPKKRAFGALPCFFPHAPHSGRREKEEQRGHSLFSLPTPLPTPGGKAIQADQKRRVRKKVLSVRSTKEGPSRVV